MIDIGDVVGLLFAFAFLLIALFLCYALVRLTRVLEETRQLVRGITDKTVPLLGEVTTSVTQVNRELVRVDAIAANAQSISANVSSLTALFAATLGSPVIKVAAFSYGVRKAAGKKSEDEMRRKVKSELKGGRRSGGRA